MQRFVEMGDQTNTSRSTKKDPSGVITRSRNRSQKTSKCNEQKKKKNNNQSAKTSKCAAHCKTHSRATNKKKKTPREHFSLSVPKKTIKLALLGFPFEQQSTPEALVRAPQVPCIPPGSAFGSTHSTRAIPMWTGPLLFRRNQC